MCVTLDENFSQIVWEDLTKSLTFRRTRGTVNTSLFEDLNDICAL